MPLNQILHKMFGSLYQDANNYPFGMNNDKAKFEKMAKYIFPWRTTEGQLTQDKLNLTVSDNFADHNIGAIGMFVMNAV